MNIKQNKTNIHIYCVDNERSSIDKPELLFDIELPVSTYIHDFKVSKTYFIFYINPIEYDNDKSKSIISNFSLCNNRSASWLLIDKITGEEIHIPCNIKTLHPVIMHHINAYEDKVTENIIINSICINDFNINNEEMDGGLFQFNIDPKRLTYTQKLISSTFGEFPVYYNEYVYYLTNPNDIWFTSLTRINLTNLDQNTWESPTFVLLNECTCIRDYIVIVGYHYKKETSILFILDTDLNLLYKYDIGTNIGFALHTKSVELN